PIVVGRDTGRRPFDSGPTASYGLLESVLDRFPTKANPRRRGDAKPCANTRKRPAIARWLPGYRRNHDEVSLVCATILAWQRQRRARRSRQIFAQILRQN